MRTGFLPASLLLLPLALAACGGETSPTAPGGGGGTTYAERVAAAWNTFTAGDYTAARDAFADAIDQDPEPADAWAGLGWSELRRDDLEAAHQAFADGSDNPGSDAVRADLLAGWAFAWNARQGAVNRHAESNDRLEQAEDLEPDWTFEPLPGLDFQDLAILAAENLFALGELDASLARVQTIDPAFTADVQTPDGQAALAARIEELRTTS
jgi:tetratricopeptide (TPR) repeat protein